MKKILLVLLVIPILLNAQFGNPKIVPHESDFNFGDITEGVKVSHDFIVFNRGNNILKIERVKASCGCTAATPSKSELAPNDSTTIKVEFNSTGRTGMQKKYVYIFSNDPETPQLRLSFTTNVLSEKESKNSAKPSIKLSEYNHNFGKVKEGEILDLKVVVSNVGDSELEIKNIKSSCGCTAALMSEKKLGPNEKSELKIEFDTKNLSGQIARTVTLYSNDPKNPTRVLTLIANIEEG
jgi:hypothetical protein